MTPNFEDIYFPVLGAGDATLQKVFLFAQDVLKRRWAAKVMDTYCDEFVTKFTHDEWEGFAIAQGLCPPSGCFAPTINIAQKYAKSCMPLYDESPPGTPVPNFVKCTAHGLGDALEKLANAQPGNFSGFNFLQPKLPLPLPPTGSTGGQLWQQNAWYTCSPKLLIGPWTNSTDPYSGLFFVWSSYQMKNGKRVYNWWNWTFHANAGDPPSDYVKLTGASPLAPIHILNLTPHGNPVGGVNEMMWWLLRKCLAAALLRKSPWAQSLIAKSTTQTLVSPIGDVERDTMWAVDAKFAGCSGWAVAEFGYFGEVTIAGYQNLIGLFIQYMKWC